MRIAYLLADPGIGIFGTKGASVHAQEMIRAFRSLGHEVTVYCTKRGNRPGQPETESVPADLRDLPVVVFPVSGAKAAAERELSVLRAASRMAAAAVDSGAELIYERYSLFSDAGAQAAQQLYTASYRVPLIVEVNAPLAAEQRTHRSLHHEQLAGELTRTLFTGADTLSCVSAPVAEWASEQIPSGSATTVVVTPNGVNTERFAPTARGEDASHFTVGFCGTLKPWHGTERLLTAFACASAPDKQDWILEIIGDGPQRQALESLAAELGIRDQTIFHGAVDPEQVPGMIHRFDVAAAPYPEAQDTAGHYFSPLKVYEYMAAGVPTVASAVGEIPRLLTDAGLVVPPEDLEALTGALEQLAGDEPLRERLGATARRAAVNQHSWISRAQALLGTLTPAPLAAAEHSGLSPAPHPKEVISA